VCSETSFDCANVSFYLYRSLDIKQRQNNTSVLKFPNAAKYAMLTKKTRKMQIYGKRNLNTIEIKLEMIDCDLMILYDVI